MKITVDKKTKTVHIEHMDPEAWKQLLDLATKDYNGGPLKNPRTLESVMHDVLHAGLASDLWMAPD